MLDFTIARLRNRWIKNRLQKFELPPLAETNLQALDHLSLRQRVKNLRFVVLDLETTGLSLTRDHVVSLAAYRVVEGRILLGDTFNSLVNPDRTIPSSAVRIHGIVPSMVARAPLLEEVFDQFLCYLGTDILVGYHVKFDLNFLNICMQQKFGFPLQNLVIDAMLLCRKILYPGHLRSYALRFKGDQDLDAVAKHFGIQIHERHTAEGDALATAMIFQRILAKLEKTGPGQLRDLLST
ncbi:MAG: 3'-5' exonuclease [Desulfobacterales bacterium]